MKYENAKNVLPYHLLIELQAYVDGTCLYIPTKSNGVKAEQARLTPMKQELSLRNYQIKQMHSNGVTVNQLTQLYYLSKQAIYKILRS